MPEQVCQLCGRPVAGVVRCSACWQDPPAFEALRSACFFEGTVREMIHSLKYKRARHLAGPLAQLLEPVIEELTRSGGMASSPEVIVPVALHPARQAARGYNQSTLIAVELSESLAATVSESALRRLRDTPPQIGLSAAERQWNVRGAFEGDPAIVKGRSILLLDDVCTTGATLSACASALRRAGARQVVALTVARAR